MGPIRTKTGVGSAGSSSGASVAVDIRPGGGSTAFGFGNGVLCLPGDPSHASASARAAPYSRSPPTGAAAARLSSSGGSGSGHSHGNGATPLSASPRDRQLVKHDQHIADVTVRARQALASLEQHALAGSIAPPPARARGPSLFLPRAAPAKKDHTSMSTRELQAAVQQRSALLASAGASVDAAVADKLRAEVAAMQHELDARSAVGALSRSLERAALDPDARDEQELQAHLQRMSLLQKGKAREREPASPELDLLARGPAPPSHRPITIKTIPEDEADAIQRQAWELEQQQIREGLEAAQRHFGRAPKDDADDDLEEHEYDHGDADRDWEDALHLD